MTNKTEYTACSCLLEVCKVLSLNKYTVAYTHTVTQIIPLPYYTSCVTISLSLSLCPRVCM